MAIRSNPKLIGAFVLGALALAIIGVAVIVGGKLFQRTIPVVMYFPRSVAGLSVGAPVNFRGVRLGEVTNIFIGYDPESRDVIIPVFADLYPQSIVDLASGQQTGHGEQHDLLRDYIRNRGLRAQLSVSSLVTGQLVVNLDFYPYAVFRSDDDRKNAYRGRVEIPTIPSTLEEVQATLQDLYRKLSKLPLEAMIADAREVLQGANRLVNDPQVSQALADAAGAMASLHRLAASVAGQAEPLLGRVNTTVDSADRTLRSIGARAEDSRQVLGDADRAVGDFQKTLATVETLARNANALIEPNSPLAYELIAALREAAAAARSLNALAGSIERNPNAVIFGRVPPAEANRR